MDNGKRCRRIANSYYNLGLQKAQIRDLTGAVADLKKSLQFDKYQIDARNLLGLICYEMGETAQALVHWVVSYNLHPEKNRAAHYIREVQGNPGQLESEAAVIRKYNQALIHAQNGSADLAILQLSRVVEQKPGYVKAQMLLAVLYMAREDYIKAGKSLYKVLQIDKCNPRASWYMSIVKSNTGRADIEKRKLNHAFSHRQMQDDDIIIPPTYKESTGWQTILHIIAGLAMGAAVIFFLVTPARERALNSQHNQEYLEALELVNQKSLEIENIKNSQGTMEAERDQATAALQSLLDENGGVLIQYQRLVQILKAYVDDDFQSAVVLYSELDPALITDEAMQVILAEIHGDMEEEGYQVLKTLGDQARDGGDSDQALDYYQKSLAIQEDNPQILYDMAMIYQERGETDTANDLFGQVIMGYPDTDLAEQARAVRGY